jgi:hypothetical protein
MKANNKKIYAKLIEVNFLETLLVFMNLALFYLLEIDH